MQVTLEGLVETLTRQDPRSRTFRECARALAGHALSPDIEAAARATRAMFSQLVEPWGDDFAVASCERYVTLMAEVLCADRSPLAGPLARLGYDCPRSLLERYEAVAGPRDQSGTDPLSVRKVVVLSRVTLGADVAITRRILHAARAAFPRAEVEFAGPPKNADLLVRGLPFAHREIRYGRHAVLAGRLESWWDVRRAISESASGVDPGQCLVVDPDTRLTQLGLLPVVEGMHYRFFPSRTAGGNGRQSLGQLAELWSARLWGLPTGRADALPRPRPVRRARRGRPLAAISLGTGGRESKRLGGRFEDSLLELLRQRGFRVALDYGFGPREERLVDARVAAFGGAVASLKGCHGDRGERADLSTWRGSLSGFGDWIAAADLYVGYDSAAAHIAAAYGTPVVQVFAGAPSARFRSRWTPCAPTGVRVIPADGSEAPEAIVGRVDVAIKSVLKA